MLIGLHAPLLLLCTLSMYPTFSCHNNLTTGAYLNGNTSSLQVGDIAVYSLSTEAAFTYGLNGKGIRYIIHRVVSIQNQTYIFKGDNNPYADSLPVPYYRIVYKIEGIE